MAKEYAVELRARKIGNGFILTGSIVAEHGGKEQLPENFYRTLPELDAGIADLLSNAEQVAAGIKENAHAGFALGSGLIRWVGPFGQSDDDDDD